MPSIILGTVTAVGGGILRDICMNREPEAFQAGALYGSAALVGCIVYALMSQNHILDNYAALSCVVLVLGLRYASLFFGWKTKPPRDYTDVVTSAVSRPCEVGGESRAAAQGQGGARQGAARLREAALVLWRSNGSTAERSEMRGTEAAAHHDAQSNPDRRPGRRRAQRPQRPHHRGPRGAPPHHGRRGRRAPTRSTHS